MGPPERAVFRYHVQREAWDVWRTYLDIRNCRPRSIVECGLDCLDTVLAREADSCFRASAVPESARCYALTQSYFEEIALKFLEARQEEALAEFLQRNHTEACRTNPGNPADRLLDGALLEPAWLCRASLCPELGKPVSVRSRQPATRRPSSRAHPRALGQPRDTGRHGTSAVIMVITSAWWLTTRQHMRPTQEARPCWPATVTPSSSAKFSSHPSHPRQLVDASGLSRLMPGSSSLPW